jgi:hypothetical protein
VSDIVKNLIELLALFVSALISGVVLTAAAWRFGLVPSVGWVPLADVALGLFSILFVSGMVAQTVAAGFMRGIIRARKRGQR